MNSKLHHIKNWPALAEQAHFSVTQLAKQCDVSIRALERYFQKHRGTPPKTWLSELRHTQASNLLHDNARVKEAADNAGYHHASTFSREFKKHMGCCPAAQKAGSTPISRPSVA